MRIAARTAGTRCDESLTNPILDFLDGNWLSTLSQKRRDLVADPSPTHGTGFSGNVASVVTDVPLR